MVLCYWCLLFAVLLPVAFVAAWREMGFLFSFLGTKVEGRRSCSSFAYGLLLGPVVWVLFSWSLVPEAGSLYG